MACARIDCGLGGEFSLRPGRSSRPVTKSTLPSMVSFSDRLNCCCSAVGRFSMSTSGTVAPTPLKLEGTRVGYGGKSGARGAVVSRETLDDWMRGSVVDIVKNQTESPLLVQVYAGNNGTVKTKAEKSADWETVRQRWERNEAQVPEGVILVEQLTDDDVIDSESDGDGEVGECLADSGCRAWGIVAQGRGMDCGPVCYLLKTSRVGSAIGSGSGAFCTHFCLVKVKSFRETTKSQLQNCWLLQNNGL